MLSYGRKNPLPFPYFEAVADLWSAPDSETKGNGVKRVETVGVYPLARRAGAAGARAVTLASKRPMQLLPR